VRTHCGEVHRVAILSPKGALQEHLADVVTRAVVEVGHVEQLGLEVLEVCLILQDGQNLGLGQVRVGYLVVAVEEGQELAHVIQVVLADLGEAELVEVTEGNGREGEVGRRHLAQLGDVRVLQVIRHSIHADQHQQAERTQERETPKKPPECHVPIGEYVTHAMEGGYVGERLQVGGPDAFAAFLRASFHGCRGMRDTVCPRTSGGGGGSTLLSNSTSRI